MKRIWPCHTTNIYWSKFSDRTLSFIRLLQEWECEGQESFFHIENQGTRKTQDAFSKNKTYSIFHCQESGASWPSKKGKLMLLDKKFRIQKRHCLMIIDNCISHPNPLPVEWTNLTINFLPKNTTSHTQPCDAGIIRDLKSINARIMISNRSFITCLLFCHYWESMKRL